MPDEVRLLLAFAVAMSAAFAATPIAIAVATRTGFNDHPAGYKGHGAPTPYLGGAAVVAAFLLAGLLAGGELSRLSPIVICVFVLWCLGTADDRLNLSPQLRLGLEFGLASTLWATGLGWDLAGSGALDLVLTNVWVVGLVNAFNLMDNMDGAVATVGAVTTLATAAFAVAAGDPYLATLCVAMSGACLGFLPYNLAGPARIFLGDGGSLPIGFVVAATIMAVPDVGGVGWAMPLAALILAGLPVVDTVLVMVSRRRAGVALLSGGRDHMTHRLATRLGSPRRVALFMGLVQALLAALAIGVVESGTGEVVSAWALWFVAATAAVVLLESAAWAPERPANGSRGPAPPRVAPEGTSRPTPVEIAATLCITIACGLSPALYGFYRLSVWGPIALFMLAALLGLVLARPAAPRKTALVAVGAITALWAWSLLSATWGESVDQALLDANRWLLYAAVLAVLILLLRNDRLTELLLAAAGAAVALFGAYLVVRLLSPTAPDLFLGGRLHDPLGYINGQAGYLLMGVWPLVALAERTRTHAVAGAAVGAATVLVGLAVLGQTRAIIPAAVVTAIVLLATVPGRTTRAWTLIASAGGVAVAIKPLLDVFDSAGAGRPDSATIHTATWSLLAAGVAAGAIYGLGRWGIDRAASDNQTRRLSLQNLSTYTLALGAVVAVVGGVAVVGNPATEARDQWHAFRSLDAAPSAVQTSRFTSGNGNRYDYWRIAADQFRDQPLRGVGAGNYETTYFLDRRTTEDIRQPHSIELQTLAELGVVGGLALLAFVGAILIGFARRARRAPQSPRDAGIAVAAGGMFLVWLVHTSVDWLHLIPGITGIALCAAAALVAPWRDQGGGGGRTPLRIATIGACALVVLAGAVFVGRITLADDYRSQAQSRVSDDPRAALNKISDSLALNDEALPAYYVRASAYARLDDYASARAALLEATRREPHDFVPWGLLGDLAVRRGDLREAKRAYTQASRLNPRDAGLAKLARDPRADEP